jgi:hypothetical protein
MLNLIEKRFSQRVLSTHCFIQLHSELMKASIYKTPFVHEVAIVQERPREVGARPSTRQAAL